MQHFDTCDGALPKLPIYLIAGCHHNLRGREKHEASLKGIYTQLLGVNPVAMWPGCNLNSWYHTSMKKHVDCPRARRSQAKGRLEKEGGCSEAQGESPHVPSTAGVEDFTAVHTTKSQTIQGTLHGTMKVRKGWEWAT